MNCPHCGSSQLYNSEGFISCLMCGYERHIEPMVLATLPPEEAHKKVKHELRGRPKKATSEERKRQIIRLHKQGKTQIAIQEQTGSCPATIRKVIREAGLSPRRRGNPSSGMAEYRKNTIRRLQKEGKTISVIAQTVGVDQSYVRQVLRGKFD